jgi:hypothetical protein
MPNREPTTPASGRIIESLYFKSMVHAAVNNANIPGAFTPEMIKVIVRSYLENDTGMRERTRNVEELIGTTTTTYLELLLQNDLATKIGDQYVMIGSEAHEYLLNAHGTPELQGED